jgi:hypothetical protein
MQIFLMEVMVLWTLFVIWKIKLWKMNRIELEMIRKFKSKSAKKDLLTLYMKKKLFNNKIEKNIEILGIKNENGENLKNLLKNLEKNKEVFFDKNGKDIYYKKRSL